MLSAVQHQIELAKDYIKSKRNRFSMITVGVSVISLITAVSYYKSYQKHKQWQNNQEPILSKYWSTSYEEARSKFRALCSTIPNHKTHSIAVDSLDDLTIDLCYIPSNQSKSKSIPSHLIIHMSGTHGVEGYTGSAIQNKLLDDIAKKQNNNDRTYNILFIHCLNPFGMSNNRRFNRFNVDLNRNTILNEHTFKQLKTNVCDKLTCIHEYISPLMKPLYPWSDIIIWWRMLMTLLKIGSIRATGKYIVSGQYHKALGIFYGGFKLQNEQKRLFNFMIKECENKWNINLLSLIKEPNSKLTVIDVHTGIGKKGIDLLLTTKNEYIEKVVHIDGIPDEYLNDKYRFDMNLEVNVLKREKDLYEYSVCDGIVELLKDNCGNDKLDSIALMEIFGTVNPIFIIHALILENAIYNMHCMDKSSDNVLKFRQKKLRNKLYLFNDTQWKCDVLSRGVALFNCLSKR